MSVPVQASLSIPRCRNTRLLCSDRGRGLASNTSVRTIILGLDGLDAHIVKNLMAQGLLPAMRSLAESYDFRTTLSTTPAESGVAWTCFARGVNPGQTNLFDFVERTPGSYAPRLAGTV